MSKYRGIGMPPSEESLYVSRFGPDGYNDSGDGPDDGFWGVPFPDGRIKDLYLVKEGRVYVRDWDLNLWDFPDEGATIIPDSAISLSIREAHRLYKEHDPTPPM